VLLSKEKIMASYQNGNDDDDLDDAFMESDQNYREDRKVEGEEQAEGYEEEDDNYFEEDDFESYGEVVESKIRQSPIVKPKNSSISLVSGGGSGIHEKSEADAGPDGEDEGNIFDDDDGGGGTATEAGGEREEEIDFENQSMTLESYMEEFFKRKYENHNVKENENDPTPDAVDPTVSPSPILPPSLTSLGSGWCVPWTRTTAYQRNGLTISLRIRLLQSSLTSSHRKPWRRPLLHSCYHPHQGCLPSFMLLLIPLPAQVQDAQTQLIEISTKVDPATSISGSPLHSSVLSPTPFSSSDLSPLLLYV
jgi:hypothetical protein